MASYFLAAAKLATGIRRMPELAHAIGTPRHELMLLAKAPVYHLFNMPKADGTYRPIEAPAAPLKHCLRGLNDLLQPAYWTVRSPAAYGYVRCPPRSSDQRNVSTNARRHLHARWMLNVDLEDFFHQVHSGKVEAIFSGAPFRYPKELSKLLAKLTTLNGRLPMGSPTSPALSNFATRALDAELQQWADDAGLVYTRFVDDLTFSCGQPGKVQRPFDACCLQHITDILHRHGLHPNMAKTKFYGPKDIKIVTGLVVDNEVRATKDMVAAIERDIDRLAGAISLRHFNGSAHEPPWLKRAQRVVAGKVAFIGQALGHGHGTHVKLSRRLQRALRPPADDEVRSWLDIPYGFGDASGA